MKKFFTTDIPMKLLSLLIAVFLWVYLVVLLNPQIETSITNIPITYSDHSTISKNGYIITNEPVESVTIKLRGTRNMLSNINKNNISAYIDLSGCSQTGSFSLPVHVRLPFEEVSITDKNPYNVTLIIDKIISQSFDLNVIEQGELKEGVHIDKQKPSHSTVTVTGPSELIKSIDRAVTYINIDDIDEDKVSTSDIVLLNSRGETVEAESLTFKPETVDIVSYVLLEKKVPVSVDKITVPEGCTVQITAPPEIVLTGKKEVLETIQQVVTVEKNISENELGLIEIELDLPENVTSNTGVVEVLIQKGNGGNAEKQTGANNEENNQ